MRADELYYLRDKVCFANPFVAGGGSDYFTSMALVVWGPAPAAEKPALTPLVLPRVEEGDPAQLLRVRRCADCGKYRLLPRHQAEPAGGAFVCARLGDPRFASCAAPCPVWLPAA